MPWMMVKLTDDDISKMQGFRLQNQFEAIFMTALAPKDAAMFTNKEDVGRDNHIYYFSPKAAEIFSFFLPSWSAKECAPPKRDSVAFLVGHAGATDMLPK